MPSYFFHIVVDLRNHPSRQAEKSPQSRPSVSHDPSEEDLQSLPVAQSLHDWRFDKILQETTTMSLVRQTEEPVERPEGSTHLHHGLNSSNSGLATKGRFEACEPQEQELGWGVIRLYRDSEETPGLYGEPVPTKHSKSNRHASRRDSQEITAFKDDDCTTLCILAVPSYMTPSDFLGFVGEKTRDEVSHFRMIRSERSNRYMVLLKFRNGKKARQWRLDWNGKSFNDMGSEHCQVVIVKSITIRLPVTDAGSESSFPDMTHDPFTPAITAGERRTSTTQLASTTNKSVNPSRPLNKPIPPPTPALVELPTCPVCLERMDESTGLLTILCQHVFHCTCLMKWKGSGCPVCRYTHSSFANYSRRNHLSNGNTSAGESHEAGLNECSVCRSDANLWICLICGSVGCGRYDGAHAFHHFEETSHCFSMELASQRVWDYASDAYVHRIVQDKTDGKFVELTHPESSAYNNHRAESDSSPHHSNAEDERTEEDNDNEYVPRSKLTSIGLEYTSLLTSQLESQRHYYEEILDRAADKTALATSAAESASSSAAAAAADLASLRFDHAALVNETLPALEKDKERSTKKAERFEGMARTLEREWRDEKAMNAALVTRVGILEEQVKDLKVVIGGLEEEKRDLQFFISGGEKLKALTSAEAGDGESHSNVNDSNGPKLAKEELEGGTIVIPEQQQQQSADRDKNAGGGGKKGKAKGKGRR